MCIGKSMDGWFTKRQAAKYLGCSPGTINRYMLKGLRFKRTPGGQPRFQKSDLDAILSEDEPRSTEQAESGGVRKPGKK